jgi:hypothetical protein
MNDEAPLAMLDSFDDSVPIFRARIAELGVSYDTVDAVAGLSTGYVAKVMCGAKRLGRVSAPLIASALGLRFGVYDDPAALDRVRSRLVPRRRRKAT